MKITDGLLGEHALFYSLFDSIETVVQQASTALEIQRAFDAVRDAVLTHAAIEDELLLGDLGNGPAVVMRAEHHEIDTLATSISRARTVEEARELAGRLIDLLRDHFHKESRSPASARASSASMRTWSSVMNHSMGPIVIAGAPLSFPGK